MKKPYKITFDIGIKWSYCNNTFFAESEDDAKNMLSEKMHGAPYEIIRIMVDDMYIPVVEAAKELWFSVSQTIKLAENAQLSSCYREKGTENYWIPRYAVVDLLRFLAAE